MHTTKIAIVSFLGNRNYNIIFLSWQLFVFISLVINAEIFKMIVDTGLEIATNTVAFAT